MKLLRDYRLPPGVPRVNAAGLMYVGDLKVSMLIEDEGMLYEVVSSTLLYAHCTYDMFIIYARLCSHQMLFFSIQDVMADGSITVS